MFIVKIHQRERGYRQNHKVYIVDCRNYQTIEEEGDLMKRSGAKKTTILDFLDKLQGQEIIVTMGIGMWTGKITAFDNHSVVLEDESGISLLKIDEISAIDWAPKLEIIAP
jgi:hypothetical protein